jgi:hypothetical protein
MQALRWQVVQKIVDPGRRSQSMLGRWAEGRRTGHGHGHVIGGAEMLYTP